MTKKISMKWRTMSSRPKRKGTQFLVLGDVCESYENVAIQHWKVFEDGSIGQVISHDFANACFSPKFWSPLASHITLCSECKGDGQLWIEMDEWPDSKWVKCPTCKGKRII